MSRRIWMSVAACALLGAANVRAADKWEASTAACANDDSATVQGGGTCNQLIHGRPQLHDVQSTSPTRDDDWMVVETKTRHSYEVRAYGASTLLGISSTFPNSASLLLNRVNAGGTVLTSSIAPDGTLQYADTAGWITTRWVGAANQRDFIQVRGMNFSNPGANDQYEIEFLDTTYFVPRFNNASSQITVFLIANTTHQAVTGSVFFYSPAGALLHTEPLNVGVSGLQVLSTATVVALQGQSGHAAIAHTGGYGALAAKAVALEPSTGFSFDTLAMPLPR